MNCSGVINARHFMNDDSQTILSCQFVLCTLKYQDESLREVALKMKNGCDCPENCFKPFDVEMVYKHRLNIQDLTKTEHDMYIMGNANTVVEL